MVAFEPTYMDPENHVCHIRCNKGDEKPTNVGANSDCFEVDPETGEATVYIFNGNTKEWVELQ